MPTVHLQITGKVQGVFFRVSAKKVANQLGITGRIKNTDKGDVEAIVSGNKSAIDKFIDWCKHGPDNALVKEVIVKETDDIIFDKFEILR